MCATYVHHGMVVLAYVNSKRPLNLRVEILLYRLCVVLFAAALRDRVASSLTSQKSFENTLVTYLYIYTHIQYIRILKRACAYHYY